MNVHYIMNKEDSVKINKQGRLYAIFGILLVILCVILVRSCTIADRYSRLLGEFTALQGIADENARIAQEKIDEATKEITELDEEIAILNNKVKLKNQELGELDGDVVQLGSELVTIRTQVETIPNLKEQIVNLESQVNTWKEKFTLAELIISDKDNIIFNLKEQYELQLEVSVEYKTLYETQVQLTDRGYTLLSITQRKLRTARVGGTVKNVIIVVAGAVVAMNLVK